MITILVKRLRSLILAGTLIFSLALISDVLMADDSTEQGLIEQFGNQLKKLFGSEDLSGKEKQRPSQEKVLPELMEKLIEKAQQN